MTGSLDGDRPALSLVATAGKRAAVLEAAVEAERRGFAGLALPSLGGTMGFATSLAHVTTSHRLLDLHPADLPGHRGRDGERRRDTSTR